MRLLSIDIETSPNLAHVWNLFNTNVRYDHVLEPSEMLCFASKWYGEKEIFWYSRQHDPDMVEKAHDLLCEADVVLHYNGKRFDIPHLNREFLLAGMPPPSPFQQIDLYSAVKRRFKFPSNKLDFVAQQLGLAGKSDSGGYGVWAGCMQGDAEAWTTMAAYNKQDVVLLEELYAKLMPWIPAHPNVSLIDGIPKCACGSKRFVQDEFSFTATGKFARYQCTKCGRWYRGVKRIATTDMREAAL